MALVVLLAIGAIVHCQALFVGFVADDFELLRVAALGPRMLLDPFPAGRGTYFRPLVMGTLAIEHAISSSPLVHHLINLLVHLASGALVFVIGRTLVRSRDEGASATPFFAALVFLVHPIVAYDVNWISGRTDSFACFFSLLVLLSILTHRRILAPIALVLALASKEVALSTPIAALALHFFVARASPNTPRPAIRGTLITLFVIALGWIAFVFFRFYRGGAEGGGAQTTISIGNFVKGIASVPVLFVWPNSFWEVRHLLLTYPLLLPLSGVLVLVPIALGVRWLARRQHRDQRAAVLALFVLATAPLLPLFIASLVPTTRLMYLPLATTCIALALLRQVLEPRLPRHLAKITASAIALMMASSLVRGHRWVENSRLIATYCDDFRNLRREAAKRAPLLVSFPFELDDTPLFVHHTHATLRACAGEEQVNDTMIVVGPIVMAHSPSEPILTARRDRIEPGRIDLQFTDKNKSTSFFGFEVPLAINTPLSFPEVTFIAREANNPREVRGLSTIFPPEILAEADLLYFDGQHLRRVEGP